MGLFSKGPGHVALNPPVSPAAGIKFPDPGILTNKKYMAQVQEFTELVKSEAETGSMDKFGRDLASVLVRTIVVGADERDLEELTGEMTRPAAMGFACVAAEDAMGWLRAGVTDRRVQVFLDFALNHVEVRKGLGALAAYVLQATYFHSRLHPEGGSVPMAAPGFQFDYQAWRDLRPGDVFTGR